MANSNWYSYRNYRNLDAIQYENHPMYKDQLLGRLIFPNKWAVTIIRHTVLNLFDVKILRNQKIAQYIPINSNSIQSEMEYLNKHEVEYILSEISKL